ncbi:hypothetical protein ACFE04_031148 [Oxalis oulophora]
MGSSNGTNLLSPANFGSWMVFDIPIGINKGPVVSKWNNDAKRANPSLPVIRLPWTSDGLTAKRRTEAQSGQHITTDILALLSNNKNCVDKVGPTVDATNALIAYAFHLTNRYACFLQSKDDAWDFCLLHTAIIAI